MCCLRAPKRLSLRSFTLFHSTSYSSIFWISLLRPAGCCLNMYAAATTIVQQAKLLFKVEKTPSQARCFLSTLLSFCEKEITSAEFMIILRARLLLLY